MIHVVNKRTFEFLDKNPSQIFYIGRPSPLGNPFPMKDETERDAVCDKYEAWLLARIAVNDMLVLQELDRIVEAARQGEVYLVCWCAPKRCHGESIRNWAMSFLSGG